jgi:MFS family permease
MSSITEPMPALVGAVRRPPDRHRVGTLTLASAATLLVLMNFTAPLVTLPQTAADLHTGVIGQTWLLTSISLGLAALLLIAGSLADDRGRKRVFITGAMVFTAAVLLCATATGTAVFVVARIVAGGASAALLAASLGLIGHAYPTGHARMRAIGVWGAMLGAGVGLGPLVTAGLADVSGWRTSYWLYAGAAALLALAAIPFLNESRALRPRRLDVPGTLTLGGGLALLVAAVTEGRTGWLRPAVLLPGLAAVVLLAAFVAIEARSREPMLDLALFRRLPFVASTGGALVTGLSVVALMSYLPTVLQRSLGETPLTAAGVFSIWSGISFLVSLQVRRLSGRVAANHQLALGLLLCAAGEVAMYGFVAAGSWTRMVPGLVLSGIGYGLLNAALARLAVESVPADRGGMGSGANNTARYVGSSLGVALVVAVVAAPGGSPAVAAAHGTDAALLVCAAVALLGGLGAIALRPRSA